MRSSRNIKLRASRNSSDLKENQSTARQHTERDHPVTKKKFSGEAMPSSGTPFSAAPYPFFGMPAMIDPPQIYAVFLCQVFLGCSKIHSTPSTGIDDVDLPQMQQVSIKDIKGQPVGNDSHRTVYGLRQDTLSGAPRSPKSTRWTKCCGRRTVAPKVVPTPCGHNSSSKEQNMNTY